jgi:hypothetical protein
MNGYALASLVQAVIKSSSEYSDPVTKSFDVHINLGRRMGHTEAAKLLSADETLVVITGQIPNRIFTNANTRAVIVDRYSDFSDKSIRSKIPSDMLLVCLG